MEQRQADEKVSRLFCGCPLCGGDPRVQLSSGGPRESTDGGEAAGEGCAVDAGPDPGGGERLPAAGIPGRMDAAAARAAGADPGRGRAVAAAAEVSAAPPGVWS